MLIIVDLRYSKYRQIVVVEREHCTLSEAACGTITLHKKTYACNGRKGFITRCRVARICR